MTRKSMRSFRLSPETQKQITLIAAHLNVNQTEALELAVQDFHLRLRSVSLAPPEIPGTREPGEDEGLATQHDRLADKLEADETLNPELREGFARISRNTARMLRGEGD